MAHLERFGIEMTARADFNYLNTTSAPGTFNTTADGYIQGSMMDDPAVRNQLTGGFLANSETLPMWGGVGISDTVSPISPTGINPSAALGGQITRASTLAAGAAGKLTGFSVFNQNYAAPITTRSPVPMTPSYGLVNYFRLGSRARIVVAADSVLTALDGGLTQQQVSWDFALQRLIPYNAAYAGVGVTAASWANTGGGQATLTTSGAHGLGVGSDFTISGVTPAAYNGTFTALPGTTGSTIVYSLPNGGVNPGAGTAFGALVAGGGLLPVNILNISASNCMVVSYDSVNNVATWNYNGCAALIEI